MGGPTDPVPPVRKMQLPEQTGTTHWHPEFNLCRQRGCTELPEGQLLTRRAPDPEFHTAATFADEQLLLALFKKILDASYYDLGEGLIRFPEDFWEVTPTEGKALFRLLGHYRSEYSDV